MALFYRLRSAERAINEIKDEYFFFSSPENLNDPMEWYVNLFWCGDVVVWKNLFRHYLLCIDFAIVQYHLDIHLSVDEIVLRIHSIVDLPERRDFITGVVDRIFDDTDITSFIQSISSRQAKIYDDELSFYLDIFKDYAIGELIKSYNNNADLIPDNRLVENFKRVYKKLHEDEYFCNINKYGADGSPTEESVRMIFMLRLAFSKHLTQSTYGDIDNPSNSLGVNMLNFSSLYIKAMKRLLFPKWSVVSFMKEISNPMVWGHYGDGHRGVCMVFESQNVESIECLRVWNAVSYSASYSSVGEYHYEYRKLGLRDVEYVEKLPEIDFFSNIGMVPIPQIMNNWYTFKGERSRFADKVSGVNREASSKDQRVAFDQKTLSKLKAWDYEKESRLVYDDLFKPIEEDERKIKFDISQLKGVIFGFDTAVVDKVNIRKIINEKNKSANGILIDIYQAYYDHKSSSIKHFKLPA